MDQPKANNVEQNLSNKSNESSPYETHKDVSPTTDPKSNDATHEMEAGSGDIIIDPMKIEPVVTEIATEIILSNDGAPQDCSSKDCDTDNAESFEVTEQLLEVVCIAQSDSSNIDTDVIEQTEILDIPRNEENTLPNKIESEGVVSSGETTNVPTDIGDNADEIVEDVNYIEENVVAHETCDPSAMGVVEEIVTTSKSSYSVEIQEQDTTDGKESFVTKDLVTLEVVSENGEETNQEFQIAQTLNCDSSNDKSSIKLSVSESNDDGDNPQHSTESEAKDKLVQLVRSDIQNSTEREAKDKLVQVTKSHAIVDTAMGNNTFVKEVSENERDVENLVPTAENHRSVIQEIVDDWIDDANDDNNDEVCESKTNTSDFHDSVEIELKVLLADEKPNINDKTLAKDGKKSSNKTLNQGKANPGKVNLRKSRSNAGSAKVEYINGLETKSKTGRSNVKTTENSLSKETDDITSYPLPQMLHKPATNSTHDAVASIQKSQALRPGVKMSGRHLMSQIASKAEVTEVLQERIKQKQKEIEHPQGGDILFVKKITQRLSSKLAGSRDSSSTHVYAIKRKAPQLLNLRSENYSNNAAVKKTVDDAEKIETADNRELLAILEGDVDPDWSNLKPHTVVEPTKSSEVVLESTVAAKLDPFTERELALKQLLELPSISLKKNAAKKKRTFKPALSKVSPDTDQTTPNLQDMKTSVVAMIDTEALQTQSAEDDDPLPNAEPALMAEEIDVIGKEALMEGSRSGRKRKPTEKAREHEQNSTKKQKVYKGKIIELQKSHEIQLAAKDSPDGLPQLNELPQESEPALVNSKPSGRNILSKIGPTKNRMYQAKSSKMGLKLTQNMAKPVKNMPVKKLRQKSSTNVTNPKTVHMKSKFTNSPKKYRTTVKQKARLLEASSPEIKPKKKSNEIDKLLQDEGVVNLLYDVEQPERKRLVPITKSQTKVMDLHKVQRELKIRTKLVRNAVLRLRTSGGTPTKISSRSKRSVSHTHAPESENREIERNKSTRSSISSTGDFVYPAKIRNAADASVIVRRHSSSSFSSTSGSPRASIDGPDRQAEPSGSEEGPAHVTRSAKRRHSQNEKNKQFAEVVLIQKKNGSTRKKSTETIGGDNTVSVDKGMAVARPNLRADSKSVERTIDNTDDIEIGKSSSSSSGSKITTRSNGTSVEKDVAKMKKGTRTKALLSKVKDFTETEMEVAEEDKLSACLAEAASALSNVEGAAHQPGSTTVHRKPRSRYFSQNGLFFKSNK